MKKKSLFVCLLFLSFCSFSCNDSNDENSVRRNNQPDSILVITYIDSVPLEPSQPKETFVFPENVCFDWSFDEEMGVYLGLNTDCEPIDDVFHLVDTNSGSYSEVLEGVEFHYIDSEEMPQYSFKMIFYHLNGQKNIEMEVKNGKRYGIYAIFNEQGEVLIHRDYSNQDEIISYKERDSYKWTFDYDSSSTVWTLDLPEDDIKDINSDNPSITLTCLNGDFENLQYGWNYEEPLLVNATLFSGTINGYEPEFWGYNFAIEFKDGLADGDFYWSESEEDGEFLLKVLYKKGILIDTITYDEGN